MQCKIKGMCERKFFSQVSHPFFNFNNMKKILSFFSLIFLVVGSLCAQEKEDYKKTALPVEQRVNDLMNRMTLEDKVNQLSTQLLFFDQYPTGRNFQVGHVRNIGHFLQSGHVPFDPVSTAKVINEDTRKSIATNRLGIPVLQHGEALHGAQWGNATCFPQSIGMAATFDDAFYYRVGLVVAKELRAVGIRQVYAPVINISRDSRWGRTEEGYGEDVLMNSCMGVAYTKALEESGVIASPKHFVDNYGDGGHDSYASNTSWRVLRETFLEPFRACVEEGGARSIMASYNSVDGVPSSCNPLLLNDILRKEWNFKGYVVSDYGGVSGVHSAHRLAESSEEALVMCLEAGLDLELASSNPEFLELAKSGKISEETIDKAVRRVLTCKFDLGLFDDPYVDPAKAAKIVRCDVHRELATEAARKVMTLLKNENNALPLSDKSIKKIGIFGPAATILSLGDYAGSYGGWSGKGAVTPYEGLTKVFKGKAEIVLHQLGTNVNELAKQCDAVIFFAMIQEGEGVDRSIMTLPTRSMKKAESLGNAIIIEDKEGPTIEVNQEEMIGQLATSGVKTIVVLQNGSLIDIHKWVDKVDAVLEAWYPGEQGGTAIAEVITGKYNPGGRLPISWARHSGQLPLYYNIKPSGRGYSYNDDDGKPLYPFGYGLSYTTFEYSDLVVPDTIKKGEGAVVKVTVKNTGKVKGDDVVQIYLRDEYASVARPVKELKAFKRVTLESGESKVVELFLPARSFGFWNRDLKFVTESGDFQVWLGRNADDKQLEKVITINQ